MAALEGIVQLGLLAMPLGDGLNAPPSNADIGRVITGALADPGPHVGKSYRPTGPRLLAPDEIAAFFAAELGRPVRYRDLPVPLFLKGARALGYPDFVITPLYGVLQDYERNAFGMGAPTDAVLEVGGAPPEPFDQIVRGYLAAPAQRRRTAGTGCGPRCTWVLRRSPGCPRYRRRLRICPTPRSPPTRPAGAARTYNPGR